MCNKTTDPYAELLVHVLLPVQILVHVTGSNIRVGSPGHFEAELRLPRQN